MVNLIKKLNIMSSIAALKVGDVPQISAVIPSKTSHQAMLVLATTAVYFAGNYVYDGKIVLFASVTFLLAGLFWAFGRLVTLDERNGYFLDEPADSVKLVDDVELIVEGQVENSMTDYLHSIGFTEPVIEKRSAQYRIYCIKNYNPKGIEKVMPVISMHLGVSQKEMKFVQNYLPGVSAIITPLDIKEWKAVTLNRDALEKGKLIGYVGRSINNDDVTYDRNIEPHMLIAGDTNSGKTEALRTDISSMRLSGLNPEFHIIDPKEDMVDVKADFYASDIGKGVEQLERLSAICDMRKAKYSKAGCKNYFQYQATVDSDERPIMVYIDEGADLLTQDLTEELEKGDHPMHKRAFSILYYITRKQRAAGIFITFGIQHPKTETLPSAIRNNLGARLVLAMADHNASNVALGSSGAETLPKFGAFMFKTSLTNAPIIGRGAYCG